MFTLPEKDSSEWRTEPVFVVRNMLKVRFTKPSLALPLSIPRLFLSSCSFPDLWCDDNVLPGQIFATLCAITNFPSTLAHVDQLNIVRFITFINMVWEFYKYFLSSIINLIHYTVLSCSIMKKTSLL